MKDHGSVEGASISSTKVFLFHFSVLIRRSKIDEEKHICTHVRLQGPKLPGPIKSDEPACRRSTSRDRHQIK